MDILQIATTTWKSNEDRFLVFLPLFFGYLLGSCLSLRIWIATQKIPAPLKPEPPIDIKKELAKLKPRFIRVIKDKTVQTMLLFTIGFMFFLLVLSIIWEPFRYAILSLVVFNYGASMIHFLLSLVGFRFFVHRDRYRGPIIDLLERNLFTDDILFGIIFLLSLGFQIAVIWFRSNIGASVMLGMVLCEASYSSQRASICSIFCRVITGRTILLLYKIVPLIISLFADRNDKEAGNRNIAESNCFSDWFYIVFASLPLASLFSLFLRLDCANHLASIEAIQGSPADIALEEVPASEATALTPEHTTGVIVPSRIPFAFKPPYFISAFLAWLLANYALVQLTNHGLLSYSGRFAHALGLLVIAPPLMILSAVVVSMFRGEMGRLWRFNGQYEAKPINPVSDNEKVGQLVDVKETAA